MKWFKHESTANMDAKLQEVMLDYGLEGYGLYWYCLELIAGNVEPTNLTFELEHDCRIIARNTGSTAQRVQEMMARFVELGLFENSQGTITCLKMAKVSDDYTAKLIRSEQTAKKPQAIENKGVIQTPTNSEKVSLEENRTEDNRTENNTLGTSADAPCSVCLGNGFDPKELTKNQVIVDCQHCSGTGKESVEDAIIREMVDVIDSSGFPCNQCGGMKMLPGAYRMEDCNHCNGTGKEPTCNDGLQVQDVRSSRTTEQPVDWSKAPAGATHWDGGYRSEGDWLKETESGLFHYSGDEWVKVTGFTDSEKSRVIPRPVQPSKPEQATQAAEKQSKPDPAARAEYPEEFEWIWKNKPERSGSNGKKSAYNACKARIKQGATWRELAEGMQRYAAHCKADGKLNTPYVMQMQTFFGPDEHFRNEWPASRPNMSYAGSKPPQYDDSSDFRDLLNDML